MTKENLETLLQGAGPTQSLKQLLSGGTVYGPAILAHCVGPTGLRLNGKVQQELQKQTIEAYTDALLPALAAADAMVEENAGRASKGYIVLKEPKAPKGGAVVEGAPAEEVEMYDEFIPFLYTQYAERKVMCIEKRNEKQTLDLQHPFN